MIQIAYITIYSNIRQCQLSSAYIEKCVIPRAEGVLNKSWGDEGQAPVASDEVLARSVI